MALALAVVAVLNLWGLLNWLGRVPREPLLERAAREDWGRFGSISYFTTGAPWLAVLWDVLLLGSRVAQQMGSDGRDVLAVIGLAPAGVALCIWYLVSAWDRPRWALPPWYRAWRRSRNARGHDANHEVTVIFANDESRTSFAYALCSCDWMSNHHDAVAEGAQAAVGSAVSDARRHSRNIKRDIEFPLGAPIGAPRQIPRT